MQRKLTDAYCRRAKPPASGRLEISDQRCTGLVFRVTERGAKSWAFRFREASSGRSLRATIGPYPVVTLSKARERGEEMRRTVVNGANPIEIKRRERAEAPDRTMK